jgi:hypothetical protein
VSRSLYFIQGIDLASLPLLKKSTLWLLPVLATSTPIIKAALFSGGRALEAASPSRTVAGIDSAVYDRIVDQHGLESDVARVEVRGLFPLTGESVFINAGCYH